MIRYCDHHAGILAAGEFKGGHVNGCSIMGCVNRVVKDVQEHLLDLVMIGMEPCQRGREGTCDSKVLGGQGRIE